LKILVSAADKASSAGFWAHFNIVTYYYYYYYMQNALLNKCVFKRLLKVEVSGCSDAQLANCPRK